MIVQWVQRTATKDCSLLPTNAQSGLRAQWLSEVATRNNAAGTCSWPHTSIYCRAKNSCSNIFTPPCAYIHIYTHTLLILNSFPKFLVGKKKNSTDFRSRSFQVRNKVWKTLIFLLPVADFSYDCSSFSTPNSSFFLRGGGDKDYQFGLREWFRTGVSKVLHIPHPARTASSIMPQYHPLADQRDKESVAVDDSKGQTNLWMTVRARPICGWQ